MLCPSVWNGPYQHVKLVIIVQIFHDKCYQQNHDYQSLGVLYQIDGMTKTKQID